MSIRPWLSIAVLALTASPASADGSRLQMLVNDFAGAKLSSTKQAVKLSSPGHFSVVGEAQGQEIVDASGRPIGWLLGACKVRYEIDPADMAVVGHNIREVFAFRHWEEGKPFEVEVRSLAWMAPTFGDQTKSSLSEIPETREALQLAAKPSFFRPEIEFASRGLNLEAGAIWVAADLELERALYYLYDPELSRETLLYGAETESRVRGFGDTSDVDLLDERPIGRSRLDLPRIPVELTAIEVKLTEEAEELGRVHAEVALTFTADHGPGLVMHLNRVDYDVITERRIRTITGRLEKVSDSNGRALDFVASDHKLADEVIIDLGKSMKKDESVRLTFDYTTPLTRYDGNSYWRLTSEAWYPRLDTIRWSRAPFKAEILTRKPFVPFGTGRELKRWETETHHGLQLEQTRPGWFPVITAGNYFPHHLDDDKGRRFQIVSYAFESERGQAVLSKLFADSLSIYERFFPPYPFQTSTVVEANSWGWGQAPDAYITITKEAYNPGATVTNRFFSQFANEIFSHEIAHGWWGHTFRVVDDSDQWLEESFAEYSAAILLELGRDKNDLDRQSRRWRSYAKDLKPGLPIVAANRISGPNGFYKRWQLLYNKGPWVLHCLRSELGDKNFYTLLKSFLRSFDGKPARTEDFRGLLEFITKQDWKPWFDKYVYGPELPELKKP